MCGIFFSLREADDGNDIDIDFNKLSKTLQDANAARGPDSQSLFRTLIAFAEPSNDTSPSSLPKSDHCRPLSLEFFASELRLRGDRPVLQPHNKSGDILCWNGEIFDGMNISPEENDGVRLFEELHKLETTDQIQNLFGTIEGPYAFVFYQASSQRLFFARDPLGRRSLLIHKYTPASPYLLLASVSAGVDSRYEFEELSTQDIYCIDFRIVNGQEMLQEGLNSHILSLPRRLAEPCLKPSLPYAEMGKVNCDMPPEEYLPVTSLDLVPEYLVQAVDDLIYHLDRSVMLRVRDIPQLSDNITQPRVAVLFSGGIDSTMLAFLAHRHIPIGEPIDLLNVAFENPRKVKLQAEGNAGGLSRKEKKARERNSGKTEMLPTVPYMVPDRVTGLQELDELRNLCPDRIWNFVEINVPYEESQPARPLIESLMSPGRTIMDMSLALALYFASRGTGQLRCSPDADPIPYTSSARVLLNGLGSDELLGGYGRHRTAYNAGGWQTVVEEVGRVTEDHFPLRSDQKIILQLQLELDRIPTRNLGRDDRVISSHGKETRHPFLSLTVVNYLTGLPVHFKMDPRLELGLGDKMLLRLAARKVGLVEASQRKKRAMQFGSHSARMEGERRGDAILE
ncbi:Asparagine synthetase domain-containing protein 1 [Hypsizygus marmoreus]|uniref:Asparagine synthetase domain-containing protein 1 n=1 Tax=Hypsizygus marmoreus TaxID=39966 RepID=A0A369K401_HYPMA|nr:Asparagine synthetase domain-containing protein 1 [Hypsizygus marmoreus]